MSRRNFCLGLLLGAVMGIEAVPSHAQFFFRHDANTITVAPGPGDHPNKPYPAALSITSRAYYHTLGQYHRDRQAVQENQIRIGGSESAREGHTIRPPFYQNLVFVCGPQAGLNPFKCGGSAYYVKPRCPARLHWEGDAEVRTQRGYLNWTRDTAGDGGQTGCWSPPPPPPPPPPCSAGPDGAQILILPLDGRVSAMNNAAHQPQLIPLSNSETVGDQDFFVNEYVVAEKNPITGAYYSAASSVGTTQVAEAIEAVEASTPYRKISPERVLAIRVARHQPDYPSPPPAINFDGPILLPSAPFQERILARDESLVEGPADLARTTWSFAVELDDRDALGLERQAKVLWSERPVLAGWLDRLQASMSIQSDDQHRVLVYAVVEVDRDELRVRQSVSVRPQCCCGGLICV